MNTALNFKKWLVEKLSGEQTEVSAPEISGEEFFNLYAETYVRELAFWSCVNIVANAISKCEFRTFWNGEEVKQDEYYLWNVEPNRNQNSSTFIQKWISELYLHNEALVIESNGQLLVADSYVRTPYALYDDFFDNVTVGDFQFSRRFTQSDVLYFRLNSKDMRRVTGGIYQCYQKMLDYEMKAYGRSRGSRGILKVETLRNPQWEEQFKKLQNEYFKDFMNAENAVLPLFSGFSYEDMSGKSAVQNTRDIRAMIDDICDFTARGLNIPSSMVNGSVQDTKSATEQLITFCICPLIQTLQEEINRKRYGRDLYLAGSRLQIDTRNIRHYDMFDISTALDKLISSGAFCINDIRRALGEPPILENWADQHFMTKNYSTIQEFLSGEGGETNE